MKICLLSYRGNMYCGGQGIYVHYLARELQKLGHQVEIIGAPPYPTPPDGVRLHRLPSYSYYQPPECRKPDSSLLRRPLNLYELATSFSGTFPEPFAFTIRAYYKLKKLLSHNRFDIIHDNQSLGYGLLWIKKMGVPVIATIHHPIPIDRNLDIANTTNLLKKLGLMRWYSFCTMQRRVAKRMDRIITVSRSSAKDLEHHLEIPHNKLRVAPNGVDTNLFKSDDSVHKEPNSLILINSGEKPIKGVRYLLKALQLLQGEAQAKLTVVGNTSADGQHLKLVGEYGLEDTVTFIGRISTEELVKRYSMSEISVVPSLYEGFGLPAAEAMSCGLPVIATTAGALPEVVGQDGGAGILVPPADPDALAAAIKRLLCDKHLQRKLGEAGRRRVETNLTWEQAAKKTLEVYQECSECLPSTMRS
jgi:glycosyltransferase involved in cell wall biosynthesis